MDCAIDWTDYGDAWVSGDERGLINQVRRLQAAHPDEVRITAEPESNGGMIVARVPRSWVRIHPPRRVSDEQKAKSAERLAKYRQEAQKGA